MKNFIDRFIFAPIQLIVIIPIAIIFIAWEFLIKWFDPSYKEDDFDRIEKKKKAAKKFDEKNKV